MKKRQIIILATMALGIFLCMLDTTVMNIALPAIQTGLHTDLDTLQWALNVYTITFAALTIPLGRIADQIGRHKVYVLGLILFFTGSLLSAASSTVTTLISGRELQSIGAAIIFPASMTIGINSIELSKRNRAVVVLGITQGLAAAFGPTIGGLLTQVWGWRGIFYINIPLVLIAIVLCLFLLPMRNEKIVRAKLDITGMLLAIFTLFSLTLALVQGSEWGWSSSKILCLFVGFVVSLGLFIWREASASDPMIRLDLFKYRHFTGAVVVTVFSGIFFVGMMVLMPSFFTKIQGHTELEAALMITPASAMVFLFSPVSGLLLKKAGSRLLISLGLILLAFGYVGISLMNPDIYWQFAISCILIGAGYGIIIGPITVLSAGNFTGELLTASQSVTGVFRQIGTVLAVAIFVSTLSTNLGIAKAQVWSTAQTEIKKISVSRNERKQILQTTHKSLYGTGSSTTKDNPAINSQAQEKIVMAETKRYLTKHDGIQWPTATKEKVQAKISVIVKEKVRKINQQVDNYRQIIAKTAKKKMTIAFIKPYQIAMPFAWMLLFTVFIFEKRKQKSEKV
ncbi:MFS transporter [Liquorilactobacillus mali]|uniref:Major facilitator superfamily permease n=1 Tax=Liquorilactobacillus mali KCTC 3596 = DSM 20444 TaxID=1046596 RepID=J1F2T0_9LACO|nr:MFS transporter [Liquorilactobacillus mali]EJE99357.1 major facilitator superfamily permease [Liquorilactobacillus mali KCTC 3596 = DSM 20444]KRN09325.1 major facilitator superfamily permease [Liquorilactobacillus mali KCTC 3596 = DSM 20444]QFQ74673.1 MFS transporter [Liquorilactobacillus mali]